MDSEMYYVFRASGGEMPRTPHDSLESAMEEVRRLAKKEGRRNLFHVVKCVATVRVDLTMTETVHLEKAQVAEQSKYPRYFVGRNWGSADAYVRYDSATVSFWVKDDGTESDRPDCGLNIEVDGAHESWREVTKEEALSRVTKKPLFARLSEDLVDPDEGTGSLLDMYRK